MDSKGMKSFGNTKNQNIEDDMDLKRGPWTVEEDFKLINYIAIHGEGRWNSLARCAELKRTGKSCRLRWLNYLRPDVRRGNITLEEQLLILELHSRWGNRWSKIAQYLPGRTDNEIKNYWRTRVQKHAKQLKCDVNSKQFKDTMRYLWMPRLVERIQATAPPRTTNSSSAPSLNQGVATNMSYGIGSMENDEIQMNNYNRVHINSSSNPYSYTTPDNSSASVSPSISDLSEYYTVPAAAELIPNPNQDYFQGGVGQIEEHSYSDNLIDPSSYGYSNYCNGLDDFGAMDQQTNLWFQAEGSSDSSWNVDQDLWFLQQQLNNGSM